MTSNLHLSTSLNSEYAEPASPFVPQTEFERRLEQISGERVLATRSSLLKQLIRAHGFLAKERAAGRDWETLNGILGAAGLSIETATLRSYWSLIQSALQQLHKNGKQDVTVEQVHAEILRIWRKEPPVSVPRPPRVQQLAPRPSRGQSMTDASDL